MERVGHLSQNISMNRTFALLLAVTLLLVFAHRLLAPISESTPAISPKPRAVAQPKPAPQAGNSLLGTWNLNEGESTLALGTGKSSTVFCKAAGDSVRITADGTDGLGKLAHSEWTGRFDGRDYPVIGDPFADSRSYTKLNDRTLEVTFKKNGKIIATGRIVVSADGKRRILTLSGTSAKGKSFVNTYVYYKQ
jgi:hypothetical protein